MEGKDANVYTIQVRVENLEDVFNVDMVLRKVTLNIAKDMNNFKKIYLFNHSDPFFQLHQSHRISFHRTLLQDRRGLCR